MRLGFRFISVLFILVIAAVSAGHAETTVTVEDCKLKVTINVALVFNGGIGQQEQADYINKLKNEAAKKWNDANIKCGDCKCELEVTVNVVVVNSCSDNAAAGRHCITVNNVPAGTFHRSTVTAGDFPNGSNTLASGTGNWGSRDSAGVMAHELGHLMGLKDEYQDVYFYFYKDSQNRVIDPPGVQSVPVSDYTQQKANQIAQGANPPPPPSPFSVEFMKNIASGNLVWSWPKPGANPNSIMANSGGVPQDSHADDIMNDSGVHCPDKCCCGDGSVNKGEQCDPKANPNGCPPGQGCSINCICVQITPICGDGLVNGNEECDPAATPTGCPPTETCVGCVCKEDPDGDGIPSDTDNCPGDFNPDQIDTDNDGFGASCDCHDNNAQTHPGAVEICNDADDNCDGSIDEGFDADGDGFTSCASAPSLLDCNDSDPAVHPAAHETCNNIDDNCDGTADEGFDTDGDGFSSCASNPALLDCNDADPDINPGAIELCNGIDDDCDSMVDEDFDGDRDGYTTCTSDPSMIDCNDNDSDINPGVADDLCNGIDDDCDGPIDEDCQDADGDGIENNTDNCPEQFNPLQEDTDGDYSEDCAYAGIIEGLPYYIFTHINGVEYMCGGNICDYDDDNDLVTDAFDLCPETFYMPVDVTGCNY